MSKKSVNNGIKISQNIYDELNIINNIVYLVRESCINKEIYSEYYTKDNKKLLSEERNRYITALSLTIEHINNIERLNEQIENLLS